MRAFLFLVWFPFCAADAVLSSIKLGLPGVARQPLTFLVSPRKVSKRRRPRSRSPCGVPVCASQKMGRGRNSLHYATLKQHPLLFPFSASHKRQRQSGLRSTASLVQTWLLLFIKAVVFDLPASGVAKTSDCQTGTTAQTCLSEALA